MDATPNLPGSRALDDPPTRTALLAYAARAIGLTVLGVAGVPLLGGSVPQSSDASGISPFALLITVPVVAVVLGLGGIVNVLRLYRVLAERPWTPVDVAYERSTVRRGPPTLRLTEGERRWDLMLVTYVFRYRRFDQATLLVAGGPDAPGPVATLDRRHLVWGRRPATTR